MPHPARLRLKVAFCSLLSTGLFSLSSRGAAADDTAPLPGTAALEIRTDWPDRLMDGAHLFLEKRIAASPAGRAKYWHRDTSSPAAYEKSIAPNRKRFAKIIGVVDARVETALERFGTDKNPELVAETERYRIYQVRWAVFESPSPVHGEGLLLTPKAAPLGCIVAIPDADWTPEDICGLTGKVPAKSHYARRLAENGFEVVVPAIVSRGCEFSGNPAINMTGKPHREWIYHMAYQMGRHVIGYEVQRVLAAVTCLKQMHPTLKVGVMGCGEGGLIALYSAAVDTRIDAALVGGYFQQREGVWREPIYRNVWGLLREFGDAEIATLVAPRGLVVEDSGTPEHPGKEAANRPGELAANVGRAAGGEILIPEVKSIEAEVERAGRMTPAGFQNLVLWQSEQSDDKLQHCGSESDTFADKLGVKSKMSLSAELPRAKGVIPVSARQQRAVKELENHVQWLLRTADARRDKAILFPKPKADLAAYTIAIDEGGYRNQFWNDVIGRIDDPLLPPNPRSRKIYDRPKWTGYEVVLDVFPDVIAYGVLLLPKDLKPGERRPVVVCQHGRNGVPRDTIEGDSQFYHDFAARLCDQGFIVFAPHNLYRTEQRYRWLQRKANSVGLSMFSIILAQHDQILRWLDTLPNVDPQRIAFYGLSYGGETAVRVPPLLGKYCLSICSADFNDWARRVADAHSPYGYPFHDEWEMPYFNMGNTFNYAELAALMVPRPFMVERGHDDGVGPDEWVAYEFAKVKRLYDKLGIGDRAEMEVFNGPHTINGKGTFAFLHKHLNWPDKQKE